jgi:hypothetical protein
MPVHLKTFFMSVGILLERKYSCNHRQAMPGCMNCNYQCMKCPKGQLLQEHLFKQPAEILKVGKFAVCQRLVIAVLRLKKEYPFVLGIFLQD